MTIMVKYYWLSYRLPLRGHWHIEQFETKAARDKRSKERGGLGYITSNKRGGEMPIEGLEP